MKTIKRRKIKPPMTPKTTSACFSNLLGDDVGKVGSYVVDPSVSRLSSVAVDKSGSIVAVWVVVTLAELDSVVDVPLEDVVLVQVVLE